MKILTRSNDFYVYEWFIKDTGEIFYIGKGRGDRYKEFHERAYEAEKIRKIYNTDTKFVATGLTEAQALKLEEEEIIRILNTTNYCLTNRITSATNPAYSRSTNTPALAFETAPTLYASEIDQHYYGIQGRAFDAVELEKLSCPFFVENTISKEELAIVYGGQYETYHRNVLNMLKAWGAKIVRSRYAKSVSSWIYVADDYVTNNDIDEQKAEQQLGRRIPSYHLIDVWKILTAQNISQTVSKEYTINPVNNRIPLNKIRNRNNWDAGYNAGASFYFEGEQERKAGNIHRAIELFDEARANGYLSPALYSSYAMAFRKLKDVDNEIAILDEAIERLRMSKRDFSQDIISFEGQRQKAIDKR